METFIIKKDTSFETLDKTLLVVRDIRKDHVNFWEFAYNDITCEYDILANKNRFLTIEEIKVELYRSYGKNYKIVLDV